MFAYGERAEILSPKAWMGSLMAGYYRGGYSIFPGEWEIEQYRQELERQDKIAYKRIYNNKLFAAYRGKVCWLCKENLIVEDGEVYCAECKDKMRARYSKRKDAGMCVRCGNPAIEGETRCQHCKDLVNAARRIRRKRARDEQD